MDLLSFLVSLPQFTHKPSSQWPPFTSQRTIHASEDPPFTLNNGTTIHFQSKMIFTNATCSFHASSKAPPPFQSHVVCAFNTTSCGISSIDDESSSQSQQTPDPDSHYRSKPSLDHSLTTLEQIIQFELCVLHTNTTSITSEEQHTSCMWVRFKEEVFLLDYSTISSIIEPSINSSLIFIWSGLQLRIHGLEHPVLQEGFKILLPIFTHISDSNFALHKELISSLRIGLVSPSGTGQRSFSQSEPDESSVSSSQQSLNNSNDSLNSSNVQSFEQEQDSGSSSSSSSTSTSDLKHHRDVQDAYYQVSKIHRSLQELELPMDDGNGKMTNQQWGSNLIKETPSLTTRRIKLSNFGETFSTFTNKKEDWNPKLKNVLVQLGREKDSMDTMSHDILTKMFPSNITERPSMEEMESLRLKLEEMERRRREVVSLNLLTSFLN